MTQIYDIAIIGAGMAGASLAAECSADASVVMLEAEDTPGYHATGRSAAFWEECYGGPDIAPLTLASGAYLRNHGFLHRRGALYLARSQDQGALEQFERRFANTSATFSRVGRETLTRAIPGLRPQWDRAISQPDCADIDVAALHAHYLSRARRNRVRLDLRARLSSARRSENVWHLQTADGQAYRAKTVVNAAGAWADAVARMAGVQPIGIAPLRRTVVQLAVDPAPDADMPLCLDINGGFYFKPENGRLWLSPHDETPSDAGDAAPEEIDVARAIERLGDVTDWKAIRVERKWAGLRSFAPDRLPVYGFDTAQPGFFWFAGQGGFGIQTAPAAARLGAQLLRRNDLDAMTAQLKPALYSPARFTG